MLRERMIQNRIHLTHIINPLPAKQYALRTEVRSLIIDRCRWCRIVVAVRMTNLEYRNINVGVK
jgi:hypothetical protein